MDRALALAGEILVVCGGKVKVVPFVVDELSLGPVTERNIVGFSGAFPPSLEFSQGFRIGGIVSHQFFRPDALTFDFTGMRLVLVKGSQEGTPVSR